MIKFKNLFKYALPLGLTLFCWLSMRTTASFSDESFSSYGFPFPWYAANGISSMGHIVAIGPLLLDLAVYVLACYSIIALLPPLALAGVKGILACLLWLAGAASLLFVVLALSIGPSFVAWELDSYFGSHAKRHYSLQLGLGV
jgi:hypothetical protein